MNEPIPHPNKRDSENKMTKKNLKEKKVLSF